jgi:diguanylate cyclase (GGDEF)-like protein
MMVDDEPITMDVIQTYLQEFGYANFIQVEDPLKAMEALKKRLPDVLLLDLIMPNKSGLEILEEVRASKQFRHLPVVVLTASTSAEDKLRALELGATDFLAKPVDQSELCLRVRNTLVAKTYMDRLAFYDAVTGLPNIHMFNDRLERAMKKAKQRKETLSLILLSLDNFGRINATIGLEASNKIIASMAKRLLGVVKDIDTVAAKHGTIKGTLGLFRVEGYGFCLLLDRPRNPEAAALVAERILKVIRKSIVVGDNEMDITASIGIALLSDMKSDPKSFRGQAVIAKDHSIKNGGDCFHFASEKINAIYEKRHKMETGLRRAIDRNELSLHFQPIVDIDTGAINRLEALLRWQSPDLGNVPPGRFIPLAEETKLILPIGEWVIEEACKTLVEWSERGIEDVNLSVNLSAVQMDVARLTGILEDILIATGARPSFFELEITESVFLENIDQKRELLHALKDLGVRISIDDFGTGYSSLSYLTSLPIDELKIDRSFISSIEESRRSRAIVSAIIYMARSLNLRTIAEGIETKKQLDFVGKQGCDKYQGYLFSRALPKDEIAELLLQRSSTSTINT